MSDRYHCPECDSNGFEPSVTGTGCAFCDGTEGGHPPKKCVACNGTGTIDDHVGKRECHTCNGSGWETI